MIEWSRNLLFQAVITDFRPELRLDGVYEGLGDNKSITRLDWVALLHNFIHSSGLQVHVSVREVGHVTPVMILLLLLPSSQLICPDLTNQRSHRLSHFNLTWCLLSMICSHHYTLAIELCNNFYVLHLSPYIYIQLFSEMFVFIIIFSVY